MRHRLRLDCTSPATSPRLTAIVLALVVSCPAASGWVSSQERAAEPARRPLILLTNDDGVSAPGITAIAAALAKVGEVLVVAPAQNYSGSSQSLKLDDFIRVRKLETPAASSLTVYAVEAPPASCVAMAIEHFAGGRKIDLVVSGINRGQNVGLDLGLSGTVGAARMAAEMDLPALAFSLAVSERRDRAADLELAAQKAADIAREALDRKLPPGSVVCVNFPGRPAAEWKQPVLTVPGGRGFRLIHELRRSTGSDSIYEPIMPALPGPFPAGSDSRAVADGHVSICLLNVVASPDKPKPDLREWKAVAGN